jgi:uncharacterized SAM-binding protein YcdF (DUF218 family)
MYAAEAYIISMQTMIKERKTRRFVARVTDADRLLFKQAATLEGRSMATFIKAGWNVTAYPVDFRTGNATPWTEYSLKDGARNWQMLFHECLGWLAYRLTGRL